MPGTQKINYPEQINGTLPAGGGSGLGFVGWDEGVFIATGTILNVTGSRLLLSASGTVFNLNASPDPQELIGVYGLANGVPLGTGTWLDFGNNLTATISGTVIRIDAAAGGSSTGTITIQDEGITKGNVSTLNFVGANVQATVSGIIGTVSVTGSSGGGGNQYANYILGMADSSLPSGTVIPSLRGSADIAGAGGAGFSYEFDSGVSPFSWSAAIDAEDVNTTVKSCLFIQDNGNAESLGTLSWSPTGTFDIRTKVSLGAEIATGAGTVIIGLAVGDSAMNNRVISELVYAGSADAFQFIAATYAAGSYTQRGATNTVGTNVLYLRITRDNSNNVSFYYSMDGITWLLVATQSFTFTAGKAGFRFFGNTVVTSAAIDWFRANV